MTTEAKPNSTLRNNLLVALVVLVVIGAGTLWSLWGTQTPSADDATLRYALVHDGDGGITQLSLAEDTRQVIRTEKGENTVVVSKGEVSITEADCDNLDCVHQGAISEPGRQIICLPHELWIEVVDAGASSGVMDESLVAGGSGADQEPSQSSEQDEGLSAASEPLVLDGLSR